MVPEAQCTHRACTVQVFGRLGTQQVTHEVDLSVYSENSMAPDGVMVQVEGGGLAPHTFPDGH